MATLPIPTASTPLNLKPVSTSAGTTHCVPKEAECKPWKFDYKASADGEEEGLLIMLHGFGDTKAPFFKLGESLKLPGTCILSVQGLEPVPLIPPPSFSYFPLYSSTYPFLPLPSPSPFPAITPLLSLLAYLTTELGWRAEQLHLFGWGQGGSVALEIVKKVGVDGLGATKSKRLGSVVSICGPLLTIPPMSSPPLALQTPALYLSRPRSTSSSSGPKWFVQTFAHARYIQGQHDPERARDSESGEDEAMLRGPGEWKGVMEFLAGAGVGRKRGYWEKGGGGQVYEVVR